MMQSLAYFVMLLRKEFTDYCNEKLQEMGLSQGLLFFILYVGRYPLCAPKEVAEALHQDFAHTTRSLLKLEQGGFLMQETNPKDRRAHILRLTDKGEAAFAASHDLFAEWDEEVMKGMEPSAREQLMRDLGGLIQKSEKNDCVRDGDEFCDIYNKGVSSL